MKDQELVNALRRLKVETGSLACLGCGYEHNCSAKDTAEALFIHRNTLSYRMNKIKEILGCDIDRLDTCMLLRSAFMIRNYRNSSAG